MAIDSSRVRKHLKAFDFKTLFIEELGWDHHSSTLDISIDDRHFTLSAIAHKRGFVAFVCPLTDKHLKIDDTIRKIETHIAKTVHEHIVIYTNADQKEQVWQWARREPGKPIVRRHHHFSTDQSGDSLIQKLQQMAFDLEDEERLLGITDVVGRVRAAFDVDRVTKRFYDRFKAEHDIFLKFIKGIPDEDLLRWYASVMLNRLMFIYFLQKKGLLDNNHDYLREHLNTFLQKGKDRFYVDFLCPLFFEGFAQPKPRTAKVEKLLGNVPYLNGGIFQKHQIEQSYGKAIEIPDAAFVKIFDFFDGYQWHLDERPLRDDREINPDVLGYIFEKYINQKQMGAYYTKEDITEYISKNTVIPRLFDMAKEKCKIAFEGENAVWRLCADDPDRYIYDAVKKGVDLPLPDDIADGLDTARPNLLERRKKWNMSAAPEYALPTEIWRETVARRSRYQDIRAKLAAGQIRSINDFITYNLDIRQFAQDVVETCEGPELLRAFWHAIVGRIPRKSNEKYESGITILDPTCGSGAFLFAALNILEPLYEACLERMQLFVDDLQRSDAKRGPEKYADFKDILADVQKHPSPKYFIYKSIIINNLFGVDIMEEAVEICKLRLFLKLIAQVEKEEQIEPLPDIDFNIRAGNTLVGYATQTKLVAAIKSTLDYDNTISEIEEKAEEIYRLYLNFREQQTKHGGEITIKDKLDLEKKLSELESILNGYLAGEYQINFNNEKKYKKWLKSYHPFHWLIDYYGVINVGGFDVIIGNPPYVEYSKVRKEYVIRNYKTEACGNLYAYVLERSLDIMHKHGRMGMIVQLPIVCTDRMQPLQKLCLTQNSSLWFSSFDDRPARLFDGLEHIRASIVLSEKGTPSSNRPVYSTTYNRWYSEARASLFQQLIYSDVAPFIQEGAIPKIGDKFAVAVRKRIAVFDQLFNYFSTTSQHLVYFHNAPQYWIRAMDFVPYFWNERDGEQTSTQIKSVSLKTNLDALSTNAMQNSTLFYWWFIVHSDCRHLNLREIQNFLAGLSHMSETVKSELTSLAKLLMADYKHNARRKECEYKTTGKVVYDEFFPKLSKPIIDQIDQVLAKHYGFTDEELDFIINYDIKYRIGKNSEGDEDQ